MVDDHRPSVRKVPSSGVHVAVTLDATSDHNLWSDLTMDVGNGGGVFIATHHPLTLGTMVHLLLTFEGDEVPLAASGVVRWSRAHREDSDGVAGVGIRFIELDAAAIAKVTRFARECREPMIFELDEVPMRKRSSQR